MKKINITKLDDFIFSFCDQIKGYKKIMLVAPHWRVVDGLIANINFFTNGKYLVQTLLDFARPDGAMSDFFAQYKRIIALQNMLLSTVPSITIAVPRSLIYNTIDPKRLQQAVMIFKPQEAHNLYNLATMFASVGYVRVDLVQYGGEFAIRGDIVDFSIDGQIGYRLDFSANTIESIRSFDPKTQLSIQNNLPSANFMPISEFFYYGLNEKMDRNSVFDFLGDQSLVVLMDGVRYAIEDLCSEQAISSEDAVLQVNQSMVNQNNLWKKMDVCEIGPLSQM